MSLSRLLLVYLGGLGLLGIAVLAAVSSLPFRGALIMACAFAEAALVLTWFVELRASSVLVRLFALGTVFWVVMLFIMPMVDWLYR